MEVAGSADITVMRRMGILPFVLRRGNWGLKRWGVCGVRVGGFETSGADAGAVVVCGYGAVDMCRLYDLFGFQEL